jgi:drug/metabolite transporter (DMT)-like permease
MTPPDRTDAATALDAPGPSAARLSLAAGLIVVSVWGANFAVQKALFGVLPPGAFLFARYLMMPLPARAAAAARQRRALAAPAARDVLRLAWPGPAGAHAARQHGHLRHPLVDGFLQRADHGLHAGVHAADPALGGHRAAHPRPGGRRGAGLRWACCSFLSDKLLGGQWAATGGDLMLLFAASLFSYYTVMSKPLIQRHGGVAVMAYATLAGSPLIVLALRPRAGGAVGHAPWVNAVGAWHWGLLLWASLVKVGLHAGGWLVATRGAGSTSAPRRGAQVDARRCST